MMDERELGEEGRVLRVYLEAIIAKAQAARSLSSLGEIFYPVNDLFFLARSLRQMVVNALEEKFSPSLDEGEGEKEEGGRNGRNEEGRGLSHLLSDHPPR